MLSSKHLCIVDQLQFLRNSVLKGRRYSPSPVQFEGSTEPRSPNRPKVVGKSPAVSPKNTSSYKRPSFHHHIGCIRSGLGSMVLEKISSKPMVPGGNVLAYKPKGTLSCKFGSKIIFPISNKSVVSHLTSNSQSASRFIYKPSGGKKHSKLICQISLGLWNWSLSRQIHISVRYIPDIFNKHTDLMSRRLKLTEEWKLNPVLFQSCSVRDTTNIFVCDKSQHSAQKVCTMDTRPSECCN